MLKMFAYGALQKGGYMRSPGLNDWRTWWRFPDFIVAVVFLLWHPSANLLDMLVVGVSLVSIIFSDRCPIFTCPSLTIFPSPFRCPSLLVHVIVLLCLYMSLTIFACPCHCPSLLVHVIDHLCLSIFDHLNLSIFDHLYSSIWPPLLVHFIAPLCLSIFDLPILTSPCLWSSLLVHLTIFTCPCPRRSPQRWSSVRLEDLACLSCPQTSASNSESQGPENCHSGGFR